jgi:hypothetical protein
MATETKLKLEAPDALTACSRRKRSGSCRSRKEERSALEVKVDASSTISSPPDANSPEFGKKVDQLTSMGGKEIAEPQAIRTASSIGR